MISQKIKNNLINVPGWRTSRKIVVFESDDWGSIRMRSKQDYDYFLSNGYDVDKCPYNKYDSLESNTDVSKLLDLLASFNNENRPIFTLNHIVANPDFKEIRKANFTEYHYEPFTETLKRYPNHDKVHSLCKDGLEEGLIQMQLHGREHLNVIRYMNALKEGKMELLAAFEREMFSVHFKGNISGRNNFLDTFGLCDSDSLKFYEESIVTGMEMFKELWGFTSKSFIAPTYVWPVALESSLSKVGVKYLQGTHVQRIPKAIHASGIKRKYHYLGQRNEHNQFYLVRNAFFEPSSAPSQDWVNACLKDVNRAFMWKKPAIISTHRLNYVGGIFSENREKNLELLRELIEKILIKFPNVEFLSSDQLGDLIASEK